MKFYNPIIIDKIWNKDIPNIPGVYLFWSDDELIYIGQSSNLRRRITSHFYEHPMTLRMIDNSLVKSVSIIPSKDKSDAKIIEKRLLSLIKTRFNGHPFYRYEIDPFIDVEAALESYEKLF